MYPVLMVFDSLSNQFYNAYIYIHDSVGMPVFNAQVNVDGYGMYYTDSSGFVITSYSIHYTKLYEIGFKVIISIAWPHTVIGTSVNKLV